MSGIFKGDSIYKAGGSGGGYKDGGELIDGDFIEVKNNTISTYDNESRDPVNFYFEVKDGEILNSVVELTTEINSTVYVYVVKNGIYYLLGNVGGDSLNAGSDYKVNITGDSYSIEEVSDKPTPAFVKIGTNIYQCKKIGNRIWTTKNCVEDAIGLGITSYWPIGRPSPQTTYPGYFYGNFDTDKYRKINESIYPFRLPKKSDLDDLKNAASDDINNISATGFPDFPNATNNTGFSAIPCGTYSFNYGVSFQGVYISILFFDPNAYDELVSYSVGISSWTKNSSGINVTFPYSTGVSGGNIRFCMDI